MISPKLAVLTALMAVSSMGAIPALAQDVDSSVSQSITQSNEACTNTIAAVADADADAASVFGDADADADADVDIDADQSNYCKVYQSNDAENDADVDIETEG
jgi:hypothetical protein